MNALPGKTTLKPRKELTEWQMEGIVNMHRAGVKQVEICRVLGLSNSTVSDCIKRAGATGDGIPKKRPGANKKLNQRDVRALVRQFQAEPLKRLSHHLRVWNASHNKHISLDTFKKYLREIKVDTFILRINKGWNKVDI